MLRKAFRWNTYEGGEQGQALIFLALLFPVLLVASLLTIEGGRTVTEYRQMQNAADMAAIVGAQSLPCQTGSSGATCVATAEAKACAYATQNESDLSCTPQHNTSGVAVVPTGTPMAAVPPVSCSPYQQVPYGNSSDSSCNINGTPQPTPSSYNYIEVSLAKQVTVPWFNTSLGFTISTHAIARQGAQNETGYAITQLDPGQSLSSNGNADVSVTGSVYANGGISTSGTACGGQWLSAGTVSGVTSYSGGTPAYSSTAGCANPTPTSNQGNLGQVANPYANSAIPPTTAASFPNCTECATNGIWFDGTSFHTPTTPDDVSGTNVELWPGIYHSLGNVSGSVYFNPGVYTFTQAESSNGKTTPIDSSAKANWCVYGAPACDKDTNSTCYSQSSWGADSQIQAPANLPADQWNYECSPYGYWDGRASITNVNGVSVARPPGLPTAAPTFVDMSGSPVPMALNGVTIYMPNGAPSGAANGGFQGGRALAAPNPCAGTGTYTAPPTQGGVSFPMGSSASNATFKYDSPINASWIGFANGTTSPTGAAIYPNTDFGLTEEGICDQQAPYLVWKGELAAPQHLHFLWYMPSASASVDLKGCEGMKLWGIIYMPNGSWSAQGNVGTCHGSHACGAPFITGQIVTYDLHMGGTPDLNVFYRQCATGVFGCGTGEGTQLVQ